MTKIPFEIHLTISDLSTDRLPDFERLCRDMGGKAVLIELPVGVHTQQPMLSLVQAAETLDEILAVIDELKGCFARAGFNTIRHKVEIPADKLSLFQSQNPSANYQGYFEWHGKVRFLAFDDYILQDVCRIANQHNAHISQNALKGENNHRFITLRSQDYQEFCQAIDDITTNTNEHCKYEYDDNTGIENYLDFFKKTIRSKISLSEKLKSIFTLKYQKPSYHKIKVITLDKSQAEYCVYDDKLELDNMWLHHDVSANSALSMYQAYYQGLADWQLREIHGYEAFLRRASLIADPNFMIKGSYVTRQYFDDVRDRIPDDLDFVCLTPIDNEQMGNQVLGDWVQKITTTPYDDGVHFVVFNENRFWRRMEYFMNEDFPTVSTEVICYIDGHEVQLYIEVSMNLDIDATEEIKYKTPCCEFVYPASVTLPYQIAWKIHQSIVRPRLKDLVDLTFLVKNMDKGSLDEILQILCKECQRDGIKTNHIIEFFDYDVVKLFDLENYIKPTAFDADDPVMLDIDYSTNKTTPEEFWRIEYKYLKHSFPKLPKDFRTFWGQFYDNMQKAGLNTKNVQAKITKLMNKA